MDSLDPSIFSPPDRLSAIRHSRKNISLSESRSVNGNHESLHIQSHIINHQSLVITPSKISVIPIMDENWLPCRGQVNGNFCITTYVRKQVKYVRVSRSIIIKSSNKITQNKIHAMRQSAPMDANLHQSTPIYANLCRSAPIWGKPPSKGIGPRLTFPRDL